MATKQPRKDLLAVRIPAELIQAVDRYVEGRNKAEPGIGMTRSVAIRLLLTHALQTIEAGAK